MILFRKEPIPLQMRNIMLLDDEKTGGVVYVNKQTYDQALLLQGRFDGDPNRVINTIKGKGTETYILNVELRGLVENMMRFMPAPLNMLAPFIIMATQNKNIEWKADNMEMGYGILHQYSQLIDFNATTLVPAEVRMNISLPTVILMQYEVSWDEICSTLKDRVAILKNDSVKDDEPKVEPKSSNNLINKTEPKEETKQTSTEEEEEEEDDGIDWDALNARLAEIREAPPENPIPITPATATHQTTPIPLTVVDKSEMEASKNVLDEFDM